jgi:hypothetical protein
VRRAATRTTAQVVAWWIDKVLEWLYVHLLDDPHARFGRRWACESCWRCGGIHFHRIWYRHPLTPPAKRPECETVTAAATPADWEDVK